MGYRNRQRHPIYGDGTATATVEGGPHDWGPFNAYRQLVLAAGATINAPPTNKGALIIRCTERLEIAGKLDAAAKARTGQYNSRGWAAYEHGTMGTIGGHVNGSDYAGGMFSLLPIPGGGGGWGDAGAGDTHAMYLSPRKDGGGIYLWTDVFDDYRALGGVNQGDPGEDGDTCITPTVDLADFVKPELGLYAIGCGGAAGGRNGTDNGCALGGDGGGLIVLIAPIVGLRATAVTWNISGV